MAPAAPPGRVHPWADVEKIILYSGYTSSGAQVQYVGVERREGAPPLPRGNEQVRVSRYPVSGLAAGATLRIKGWRLDREQLAAVTAAVAPGILVIDARKDPAGALKDRISARTGNYGSCDPP